MMMPTIIDHYSTPRKRTEQENPHIRMVGLDSGKTINLTANDLKRIRDVAISMYGTNYRPREPTDGVLGNSGYVVLTEAALVWKQKGKASHLKLDIVIDEDGFCKCCAETELPIVPKTSE